MDALLASLWLCIVLALPCLLLLTFAFIVYASNPLRRSCVIPVTSSIVARVGHVCGVLVFAAVMRLSERNWNSTSCSLFFLLWTFVWLSDVSTAVCFLLFLLRRQTFSERIASHVYLACLAWGSAICISLVPAYAGNEFLEFKVSEDRCSLNSLHADRRMRLGLAVSLVVFLLAILASVSCLWVKTRRRHNTHSIFCRVANADDPIHKRNVCNSTTSDDVITFSRLYRENKVRETRTQHDAIREEMTSDAHGDVTELQRVAREEKLECRLAVDPLAQVTQCAFAMQLRHVCQVMTSLALTTLAFNIVPQLVSET